MAEVDYQQAVTVLQDRIGVRWEGIEIDGRHEMARVLKSELGLDNRQANETLDAMIKVGTLRFHHATSDPNDAARAVPEVAAPAAPGGPVRRRSPVLPAPPPQPRSRASATGRSATSQAGKPGAKARSTRPNRTRLAFVAVIRNLPDVTTMRFSAGETSAGAVSGCAQ